MENWIQKVNFDKGCRTERRNLKLLPWQEKTFSNFYKLQIHDVI